jgi:hypothetical protein
MDGNLLLDCNSRFAERPGKEVFIGALEQTRTNCGVQLKAVIDDM